MDERYINPFLDSFLNILPQLGITNVKKTRVSIKGKVIESPGVVIILGIVGDIRGNVIYATNDETARKIASVMMMGMPVDEFNEMAQSAVSELTNMLTANAAMSFANEGIKVDISTPTLMHGEFTATGSLDKVISMEMLIDEMPFEVCISIENIK